MKKIAIIGSGISGLTAAYYLNKQHDICLYEADSRLGGHTATKAMSVNGKEYLIDTGFIVPKPVPPAGGPGNRIAFTPNPAGQSTFVSLDFFDVEKNHLLRIYDSQGRQVRSLKMPESPFLLEKHDLPPGVYQVSVWVDEKVITTGLLVFGE